ncbi:MAG: 2-oxo acid dehydrogenase subunit E2 [Actinomycetota bacterium]|nr:2-oxo acid dehydrogenase subunit E2 [Actinomycetota bacterium]
MSSSTTSGSVAAGLLDVTMPQMGVSVAEGTIVEWKVAVGDEIAAEATICEISTDKIDTEVPAPAGGTVTEILVAVGETVEVGTVLARLDTGAEGGGSAAPARAAAVGRSGAGRHYSPVVSRIAAEHEIDLDSVAGTGRDGRVRKQDVLALVNGNGDVSGSASASAAVADPPLHIESPYRPDPPAPAVPGAPGAPGGPGTASTAGSPGAVASDGDGLSRMRRQIGEHMKRSLETAATCTTWIEVDMSRVESERARLKVTALAFVARAVIVALREYPALNAWLEGERYTRVDAVNLGIAVSLGEDGLIVPVVHNAHELSEEGLAARIRELARRARARELTADDVRDGTFTITNPGQYGSIMATPIINQPQVGILDLEALVKRPVVVTDAAGNDAIAIRPMTILGLSWDHRALDGVLSAQFLAAVKRELQGG